MHDDIAASVLASGSEDYLDDHGRFNRHTRERASMTDEPSSFGLVMPFVVTQSQAGPHADEPFVAGYECGYLDHLLESRIHESVERYVHTSIVPQLDLVAMRHGYTMTSEPWQDHPDQWTLVTLTIPARTDRCIPRVAICTRCGSECWAPFDGGDEPMVCSLCRNTEGGLSNWNAG